MKGHRPTTWVEVRFDDHAIYPWGVWENGRLVASWTTQDEAQTDAATRRLNKRYEGGDRNG